MTLAAGVGKWTIRLCCILDLHWVYGKPSPTTLMEIRCTMMCDNSFQCKFNFSGVDISITWDSHLVRSQNGMMMMFETKQFLSVILATNHQTHIRLYIQCLHQQYRLCKVVWIHFKLEWWRLSKQNHFYLHLFAKPYPSRWLPINQSITDQTTCGHMGFTWCRITCNGNMVLSSDETMMSLKTFRMKWWWFLE